MLKLKFNAKNKRSEYALISESDPEKILEWFGPKKPNAGRVTAAEKRVTYFKSQSTKGGE
jgi:hypothetical protein